MSKLEKTRLPENPINSPSPNFHFLLGDIKKDPMAASQAVGMFVRKTDADIRERLYESLALIYAFAFALRNNHAAMERFLDDEFWSNPEIMKHSPKSANILRLCFRYHYEAKAGTTLNSRCADYARALQGFFDGKMSPDELAIAIRDGGGIEKLIASATLRRYKKKINKRLRAGTKTVDSLKNQNEGDGPKVGPGSIVGDKHPGDVDDHPLAESDSSIGGRGSPNSETRKAQKSAGPRRSFNPSKHILVDANDVMEDFFAVAGGSTVTIDCEVTREDDGFLVLTATDLFRQN